MSVLVATMLCHLCLNMISVSEYQCNYELSELRVMLRLKNDICNCMLVCAVAKLSLMGLYTLMKYLWEIITSHRFCFQQVADFQSVAVKTPYPQLKGSTCAGGFALFVEKELQCIIEDLESAVLTMLYCFWIFDICFPKVLIKTFSLLAYLLGIHCDTIGHISVQNIINQL